MWVEFYLAACHLHEKTPTKSLKGLTPYELWHEQKPDYSYIREIGCQAFVLIQNKHNPKIYERSIKCILVGYNPKAKEYRCYDKKTGQVYSTYHVRFLESHKGHPPPTPVKPDTTTPDPTALNQICEESVSEPILFDDDKDFNLPIPVTTADNPIITPPIGNAPPPDNSAPPGDIHRSAHAPKPTEKTNPDNHQLTQTQKVVQESKENPEHIKAAKTAHRADTTNDVEHLDPAPNLAHDEDNFNHDRVLAAIAESGDINPTTLEFEDEPKMWREARECADAKNWEEGYRDELKSLKEMGVYELVLQHSEVPQGHKVRKGCPIFKIKRDENRKAIQFKVRLVFKGYEQIYGKDYTKTTSPTACMESW